MNAAVSFEQLKTMYGQPVYDRSGEKIGSVEEIYYDTDTNQPEWIGIGTGIFKTKRVLVPAANAEIGGDSVTVPYDKGLVKDAPDVDEDEISQEAERDLYAYYSLTDGATRPGATYGTDDVTAGGVERDPARGDGDIIRSEEELRVGKRTTEAGRVRLRKWVETEPVQAEVELRRETVRVERQPIDQPVSGAEIGEDSIEVGVTREEPVVEKQAVAKERIGLEKDVEAETRTVTDEVRKERVEIEGDAERGRSADRGVGR